MMMMMMMMMMMLMLMLMLMMMLMMMLMRMRMRMMMMMMMMMMIWPRSKLSRKRAFQNEYFHAFQNDTFPNKEFFGLFSASNGEPRREEAVCYGANSIGTLIKKALTSSQLRTSLNERNVQSS